MRIVLICLCVLLLSHSVGNTAGSLPGDTDGSGSVTIAEVQAVINAFLGITAVPVSPTVSGVTTGVISNALMYKKEATFTVTGDNLAQGISATASGACTTLTEKPGGSSTSRSYTCVPSAVGPLAVTISSGGTVLKQSHYTVPFPQVTLETTMGSIVVELRPDKAPITVDNFLQYVNDGFYDNTIFHRVESGFVIQGGGLGVDYALGLKDTRAPIILEKPTTTGLSNSLGTIAMARTLVENSATSQFFFNTNNNTSLDTPPGYAVFGTVIQGISIVKDIEAVPVTSKVIAGLTYAKLPQSMITVISARQTDTLNVTLPKVPSGMTATGGTNKVTLTWDSVPFATAYNLYWSTTPGVTIASGNKAKATSNAVSHPSLLANTTYYYIVTAVNRLGESAPSAEVHATTSP